MSKSKASKTPVTQTTSVATQLNVTLRDLVDSFDPLRDLANHKGSVPLGFTLGIVVRAVSPFLQEYDKQRKDLLDKHYTPKSKEQPREPKSDKDKEEFDAEINALLDEPVVLVGMGRIAASKLEKEGVQFDGSDAAALHWLIKNDIAPIFEVEETDDSADE